VFAVIADVQARGTAPLTCIGVHDGVRELIIVAQQHFGFYHFAFTVVNLEKKVGAFVDRRRVFWYWQAYVGHPE
jgi:hypothetical protein